MTRIRFGAGKVGHWGRRGWMHWWNTLCGYWIPKSNVTAPDGDAPTCKTCEKAKRAMEAKR